jgi:hypothetical protein
MFRSRAVNGSMMRSMIDQFPMAAVVVNCPPFKGALTACHPHRANQRADAVTTAANFSPLPPWRVKRCGGVGDPTCPSHTIG